jgi:hypothetical protein
MTLASSSQWWMQAVAVPRRNSCAQSSSVVLVTEGLVKAPDTLTITAESDLVVFGDGMESDTLTVSWGQRVEVGIAPAKLRLVV